MIILYPNRKVLLSQMRRMSPRLQTILLPNRSRETATPLLPRERLRHALDRLLRHQVRIAAHVIEYGSELNERANPRDGARISQVLVPDHSLGDVLSLRYGCGERFQHVEHQVAAVELEGEERGMDVLVCGSDVVEHAG